LKGKEVIQMANTNQSGTTAASPGVKEAAPKGLRLETSLFLKGVSSAIPDGTSLLVAGQGMTKDALKTQLQAGLDLYEAVEARKRDLKTARQTLAQGLPAERKQVKDLKDALVAFFGRGSPVLAQFGIKEPGSRRPLTAQQLAMRAAKAMLTREARHTMGSRQKQSLHVQGTPTLVLGPDGATVTPAGTPVPTSSTVGTGGTKGAAQ
jgi:hypothetical protein